MSDDDIDLDRVIVDPEYRRKVIAFLNGAGAQHEGAGAVDDKSVSGEMPTVAAD